MTDMSRRTFVTSTAAVAGAGLLAPLADRFSSVRAAPALAKRQLGRTGLELTLVGFGGARCDQPEIGDEEAAEFLRHFIDRGSNFVETSANYGPNGESEVRIGLAMKTHRSKVFLETKVDARDYDGACARWSAGSSG
jgi:aryl-alcohol dehydrogenase-like predicted oxidoreductase